jgi:hypothetical protein
MRIAQRKSIIRYEQTHGKKSLQKGYQTPLPGAMDLTLNADGAIQ